MKTVNKNYYEGPLPGVLIKSLDRIVFFVIIVVGLIKLSHY